MKELLKKVLIYGAIYLVLLLCVIMMSNRIERLENNEVDSKVSTNTVLVDKTNS